MVELRILGTVSLVGAGGRELRSVLAQPKRVALLAYLAAARPRRFHRRDSLLALFWPELDQEHARAALRQSLHILRGQLGDGALESRRDDEIGLAEASVWCDAEAFDAAVAGARYDEALELYHGDLLDGFFISAAPSSSGGWRRNAPACGGARGRPRGHSRSRVVPLAIPRSPRTGRGTVPRSRATTRARSGS